VVFGKWRRDRTQDSSGSEGSDMSGGVWMSSLLSNYDIGMKQGARTKFYDHEWNPADIKLPVPPPSVMEASRRHMQGFALKRSEFPEAGAVWGEKRFKKVADILMVGPFYAVRGRLAEVLSRFDLGEGGLITFPFYKADLETPYSGELFLLNFGCIKNTLLPEQCDDATTFLIRKATGVQIYHINDFKPDGDVVLTSQALSGPDLWFEEAAHHKIFLSDALAQALIEIGMGDVFRLKQCQID
jgi:hypothetical protein